MRFNCFPILFLVVLSLACSSSGETAAAASANAGGPEAQPAAKSKFRPYDVIDEKQGGMVVSRLAVPQDWKATSRAVWNYADFYSPVHVFARVESPDASSWIEFFPAEFFVWLDPAHDRAPIGRGGMGGIHHPNITLPEAMVRYVIAPNRAHTTNLRVLGYRPVKNLAAAFPHVFDPRQQLPAGEGICMRVSYQLSGAPVDEEFYGFMTQVEPVATPGSRIMEYRRRMIMVHSMGAKSGKLESVRPLLGFVATSVEPNPAWQQRFAEVKKMQIAYYDRIQAYNRAEVQAAAAKSKALTAQSNQFMAQIDANLAAQNRAQSASASSFSSSSTDDFYKRADDFDQNMRGTEHMKDQYGQVSDQYNDYNYHWTDGFGSYVHANDPNFDPNRYLNGNYQQMTPER